MQKKLNKLYNKEETQQVIVGLYVRVSTHEQARDGYSIQEQTERLTKYAEAHGWIVKDVYSDAGYSGTKLNRPAINRLITDIQENRVNKVIVYKLDRLSRSQKDTLYLIEDVFLKNNVDFVSMTENFDTATPLGKAMIGILSVFAQLEHEQIKERIATGHEGRAKAGLWGGGGMAPTGYTYDNGKLTIEPYSAGIVQRIYSEFLNGVDIVRIEEGLNRDGVKGSHGSFCRTTIRNVLNNPLYAGYVHFNGKIYKGQHEAIVTRKEWEQASEMLRNAADKDKTHPTYSKRAGLITSLCYCGECGQKMISRYWRRDDGTYKKNIVCPHKGETGCKSGCYDRDEVEQDVLNQIIQLQLDPDSIPKLREQRKAAQNHAEEIEAHRKEIDSNNTQISQYMDLYATDGADIEGLSDKISVLIEKNEELTKQIKRLKDDMETGLSDNEVIDRVIRLTDYIETGDTTRARKMVDSLIDHITLSKGGHPVVFWKF